MRAILLLVVIATAACGSDHVAEVERAEPNAEAEGVLPNAVEAAPAVVASGVALPTPSLSAARGGVLVRLKSVQLREAPSPSSLSSHSSSRA